MRKVWVLALVLFMFSAVSFASEGPHVPSAVEQALSAKYGVSEATNWVVYREDGRKIFATRWHDKDGVMHEADFDSSGNVIKTARSLKAEELPKAVAEAIEKKVPGAKITEVKVEEGKGTEYNVQVTDASSNKRLVVVNPDGTDVMVFDF